MNAIDRAGVDTRRIFSSDARFSYNVGHDSPETLPRDGQKLKFHYNVPIAAERPAYNGGDDPQSAKSGVPGRRSGHAFSSRNQGTTEGNAPAGGQASHPVRGGRSNSF